MIGSGDVDHSSSSNHEEYSELLELPVKYLRRNKAIKKEAGKVIELEEVQFVKWMERFRSVSESEQVDQEKLKVVRGGDKGWTSKSSENISQRRLYFSSSLGDDNEETKGCKSKVFSVVNFIHVYN